MASCKTGAKHRINTHSQFMDVCLCMVFKQKIESVEKALCALGYFPSRDEVGCWCLQIFNWSGVLCRTVRDRQ